VDPEERRKKTDRIYFSFYEIYKIFMFFFGKNCIFFMKKYTIESN
jgi:hypothetical protein